MKRPSECLRSPGGSGLEAPERRPRRGGPEREAPEREAPEREAPERRPGEGGPEREARRGRPRRGGPEREAPERRPGEGGPEREARRGGPGEGGPGAEARRGGPERSSPAGGPDGRAPGAVRGASLGRPARFSGGFPGSLPRGRPAGHPPPDAAACGRGWTDEGNGVGEGGDGAGYEGGGPGTGPGSDRAPHSFSSLELRKASKRLTCHKRFKIQRKVREHHRKARKEAKKRGRRRPRKDPGVPSSAPFREAVLREAEQRKRQLEELKEKQKLNKLKEQRQKRKRDEHEVPASKTEPLETEFVGKKAKLTCRTVKPVSKKSFCRELQKVIEASDILLEVLDARDPLGCRCPQVEQVITKTGGNKKLLLVLNKTDLVPKESLNKWVQSLKKEFPTVVFRASAFSNEKIRMPGKKKLDFSRHGTCLGGKSLLTLLSDFSKTQNKAIRVGVIGFPNVGKSSIINSLKQAYVCPTGPAMGLTRHMQIVHIDKNVMMLDSPSIIASPSNSAVALALRSPTNIEKKELLNSVTTVVEHCNKEQLMLRYNIPSYRDSQEFLILLAQKKGMARKGGLPKVEEAAKLFWSHWTSPKMSYYCQAPPSLTLSPHLTESIVGEMQQGLNLEELEKNNMGVIKAVRSPRLSSSMLFQCSGLTDGITDERDMPEEDNENDKEEDEDSDDENGVDGSKGLHCEEEPLADVLQPGKTFGAGAEVKSFRMDKMTEEDDTYNFNTDYV